MHITVSAYHVISKKVKNHILRHIRTFRHTCYINNPRWQSDGIIIFLCEYYIVISDRLVGSFLYVLFFLLAVILLGLHEKSRRNKDWVTEKSTKKNLCEWHHFFDCMPSFLCHPLLLSSSNLYSDILAEWPLKKYIILIWGVFCEMISWVKGQKYENL